MTWRVPSMGQIELFNLLVEIIIFSYLKPYNCVYVYIYQLLHIGWMWHMVSF